MGPFKILIIEFRFSEFIELVAIVQPLLPLTVVLDDRHPSVNLLPVENVVSAFRLGLDEAITVHRRGELVEGLGVIGLGRDHWVEVVQRVLQPVRGFHRGLWNWLLNDVLNRNTCTLLAWSSPNASSAKLPIKTPYLYLLTLSGTA